MPHSVHNKLYIEGIPKGNIVHLNIDVYLSLSMVVNSQILLIVKKYYKHQVLSRT